MYPVTTQNEFRRSTSISNAVHFEPLDCSVVGPGRNVRHRGSQRAVEAAEAPRTGRNFAAKPGHSRAYDSYGHPRNLLVAYAPFIQGAPFSHHQRPMLRRRANYGNGGENTEKDSNCEADRDEVDDCQAQSKNQNEGEGDREDESRRQSQS